MNFAEHSFSISPCVHWDETARDEQLLHAVRTGSDAAFAELQTMYSRRLYQRIFSITGNHEDAEDALQDTFIRAYLGLRSFEGRSKLSTWLMRIAINSALMSLRKRRSRPEIPLDQPAGTEGEAYLFDVRDHALDPEQQCDQNQRCEGIRRSILRLDPKSRLAVSMRMSNENSLREIASELDVSVASAKARLYRARTQIAQSHPFRGGKSKLRARKQ